MHIKVYTISGMEMSPRTKSGFGIKLFQMLVFKKKFLENPWQKITFWLKKIVTT